jgi:tryptophan synthase alpha chain
LSRIKATLANLKSTNRKAIIPYIVAGDPEPGATVALMHALVDAGADIIELGVPFSDPMAEGPVIQLAHERALVHHVSLTHVLQMASVFRETNQQTPLVLMGYANPIEAMGYVAFAQQAANAGVDGVLTVDMPPEEIGDLGSLLIEQDIDSILLISPTTSPDRIEKICAKASGYIYYVSLKGVTGAGNLNVPEVAAQVGLIRQCTSLPICVGFGIKDAASAKSVAGIADGVVVGSVLVSNIAAAAEQQMPGDLNVTALGEIVAKLVKDISVGANSVE